ncbi:MAG: hypothetical protein QOE45_3103 [Frankiaceae bacterium]|nr:hypothetical protein [Frankiaceae bacterium]
MGIVRTWGSTAAERALSQPCDDLLPDADDVVWRAITVRATPATTFRWLCQLRVAPYSYDLLDNLGRRSPRTLTPGLEDLAVGQTVATIFELASFETNVHLTLVARRARGVFGDVAITYAVRPDGDETRLLVKMRIRYPHGRYGALARRVLPAGDLVMMRKQLRNLAALAAGRPATHR